MSDNYETPAVPEFDLHSVTPEDAPALAPEDAVTPDHTASRDNLSVVERVKARARGEKVESAPPKAEEKTTRARASKPAKKAVPKTRPGALVEPLTGIYTSIGVVLTPFDPLCAASVMESAEKCATSLDALAQRNDSVRRALLALTETSAWGGVIAAHLPILLMVASHHGPENVAAIASPMAFSMNPGAMAVAQERQHPDSDVA